MTARLVFRGSFSSGSFTSVGISSIAVSDSKIMPSSTEGVFSVMVLSSADAISNVAVFSVDSSVSAELIPNNSGRGISSTEERSFSLSGFGRTCPCSHLLIVVGDTYSLSARPCWVRCFSFHFFLIRYPSVFVSIAAMISSQSCYYF